MGTIIHHAIVVTSWDNNYILKAYCKAEEIFGSHRISLIVDSEHNNYHSFFIPPDGSKEGWEESNKGDRRRARFIEYLQSCAYDDGSSQLEWFEIKYGSEADTFEIKLPSHIR